MIKLLGLITFKLFCSTSRDDEGTFTCVASNEAGETRANFQLVVLTVPKILVLEKDRNR